MSTNSRPDSNPWVRANVFGTVVFVTVVAVVIAARDRRPAQFAIGICSMVLFAIGVACTLWAYVTALEKSRTQEVGVANLFLLTGKTAPPSIKRTMLVALAAQIVAAVIGASIGAAGLEKTELNALAFGVLVPMFGIGMNGMWAAKYGSYGPRINPSSRPNNRKIR